MNKAFKFSAKEVAAILATRTGEVAPDDVFSYRLRTEQTEDENNQDFMELTITITGKRKT